VQYQPRSLRLASWGGAVGKAELTVRYGVPIRRTLTLSVLYMTDCTLDPINPQCTWNSRASLLCVSVLHKCRVSCPCSVPVLLQVVTPTSTCRVESTFPPRHAGHARTTVITRSLRATKYQVSRGILAPISRPGHVRGSSTHASRQSSPTRCRHVAEEELLLHVKR
jgi:hypothetical protein